MNDNCDIILIADSSLESSQIQKYLNDKSVNIIAADYDTHKKFAKLNLKFSDLDDFLNDHERHELYELAIRLLKWPEQLSNQKEFKVNNINILNFLGSLELHEFILGKTIKFFSIKNIIDRLHPKKNYCI